MEGQARKVDSDLGDTGHRYVSSQEHFFALNNVCLFVSAGLHPLSSNVFAMFGETPGGFPTVTNALSSLSDG